MLTNFIIISNKILIGHPNTTYALMRNGHLSRLLNFSLEIHHMADSDGCGKARKVSNKALGFVYQVAIFFSCSSFQIKKNIPIRRVH